MNYCWKCQAVRIEGSCPVCGTACAPVVEPPKEQPVSVPLELGKAGLGCGMLVASAILLVGWLFVMWIAVKLLFA